MEFYQHVPTTPHHNKLANGGLRQGVTISFENSKANTPFPSKSLNNNANTPFPTKTGLGGVKSGLQPRRALVDISNNSNVNHNTVNASAVKSAGPKTIAKTTAKKLPTVKNVRFEEDIDTCTRTSKYRATPFKPEVERAVKSTGLNWYQEMTPQTIEENKRSPKKEVCFTEFFIDEDDCTNLSEGHNVGFIVDDAVDDLLLF